MNLRNSGSISILALLLLLVGCDKSVLFSESVSFDDTWPLDQPAVFDLPQLESDRTYNLFLDVRNTNDYPFSNLFLIVSMDFPNGKVITDTLEYRMANPDGSWLGKGIGTVKDNKLWYKEQIQFTETGTYRLSVAHAVRNNNRVQGVSQLAGISDVGYSIEEAIPE
ncbi:gliding motility lipoprotein GldH [Aureitalea marina]|uniref:Gliding motility lipoprotein GldH n=1 Tax=Aureitalea marina TaxID=930804 RepID=A0A2S7KSE3_9FLAO|nr:gliding motility lipoprotein GldH [Aureitalea marina]PQB05527.1 gliding motility lipoprotein GldH [Aureitalea marina]